MNANWTRILNWTPRILGILFILFISLFALDVFEMGLSWSEVLLALFIHLIPSLALLVALILSWRWKWFGVLGFAGFAFWYVLRFGGQFVPLTYVMLAGIPLAIALLFLGSWLQSRRSTA